MQRVALPTRDYISHSSLATFQSCPLRFAFKYIEGLPEESITASLLLGQALHASVEHHFQELLAGKPAPDLDTLLAVFHDAWNAHDGQTVLFPMGEDSNTLGPAPTRPAGTSAGWTRRGRGAARAVARRAVARKTPRSSARKSRRSC